MKLNCGCDLIVSADTNVFVCPHKVWYIKELHKTSIIKTTEYKPPRWVRLIQLLSKPEDIGLGATVKRIADKFGGERFKQFATKIGIPCGCTEREEEWNLLYPNPNHRLS